MGRRRRLARLAGAQDPDLGAEEPAAAQRRRDVGGVETADREIVQANSLEAGRRDTVEDLVQPVDRWLDLAARCRHAHPVERRDRVASDGEGALGSVHHDRGYTTLRMRRSAMASSE